MKIGLFDSGMGGLLVLKGFLQKYPTKDFVYFADTLNLPYGDKSKEDLQKCCIKVKDFLLSLGVDVLVITCNSASCLYIDEKSYKNIPQTNVISPTIKKLMEVSSENDRVGVLATPFTVQANIYPLKIQSLKPQLKVFQEPAPDLASLVEKGLTQNSECKEALKKHLESLLKNDIDILVLACTHYFFLKDEIKKLIPSSIKVVDLLDNFELEILETQNKIQRQANLGEDTEKENQEDFKEKTGNSSVQIYMTQEQPELAGTARQIVKDLHTAEPPKITILNSF